MASLLLNKAVTIVAALGVSTVFSGVVSGEPVAIVDEIVSKNSSLQSFDQLESGEVIALLPSDRLVLEYYASCVRETINGGTVTVGETESTIRGGQISRETIDCQNRPAKLNDNQVNSSGVVAFRGGGAGKNKPAHPRLTLQGLSPIVRSEIGGELHIIRIDKDASDIRLAIKAGSLDLLTRQIELTPGAIYRADLTTQKGTRSLVFAVDGFAQSGAVSAPSRLIQF